MSSIDYDIIIIGKAPGDRKLPPFYLDRVLFLLWRCAMVNAEHYDDPTAEVAIARADKELRLKRKLEHGKLKVKKYGKTEHKSRPRRDACESIRKEP